MERKFTNHVYLVKFCINAQLHNILLRFIHTFWSIFPYFISEGMWRSDWRRNDGLFVIQIDSETNIVYFWLKSPEQHIRNRKFLVIVISICKKNDLLSFIIFDFIPDYYGRLGLIEIYNTEFFFNLSNNNIFLNCSRQCKTGIEKLTLYHSEDPSPKIAKPLERKKNRRRHKASEQVA